MGMTGISKSQVSRLCGEIDERQRLLEPADRRRLAVRVDRRDVRQGAPSRPYRFCRRNNCRWV
jgi:hypothetical protein